MGIFDRLSTLIRSNITDLINRAENPEKMLNQLIVDMRSQLAKAKQQVAAAIADEKRLSAQVDTEKKSAEDWERRAVLAVQEGRDDLAKQALLRHNEHAQGAVQLHETWVKHREETEKLKLSLRQLNDRIEEAKRKKNILIARQKRAEAHKRIQETMSSIGDKSVFETFERMAEQIEHEERKLIAAAEVNEDLTGDRLVKQFQALEVKADADQQLLDLKRKLGLLVGVGLHLEGLELLHEPVARQVLVHLGGGDELPLLVLDLLRHALERLEHALVADGRHGLLNALVRLGPLLARDQDVLLALRVFDAVVELAQRELELLRLFAVLHPRLVQLHRALRVVVVAQQRLLREVVSPLLHRQHRPP